MKELALDRINANSPYMVELDVSTGLFKFVSNFGAVIEQNQYFDCLLEL